MTKKKGDNQRKIFFIKTKIMKILIISLATFLLMLSACSTNTTEKHITPFIKNKKLTAEKYFIHEVTNPAFMMVKNKSLFVTNTRSDSLLYQYSIPDLNLLRICGVKGQAPGEFQLFPMFCRSQSDLMYIWGYTPFNIRSFAFGKEQQPALKENYHLKNYESFNQMHIIKDSILIYSAIPDEFAIKKINLRSQQEIGKVSIQPDDHQESYFYKNKGILSANDSFIVYAYSFKKQIDIYSVDKLELLLRLTDQNAPVNIQIGDFQNTTYYYMNIVAGNEYFYALCKGNNNDYYMEVFDYKGNSVVRYQFDIVPYLFDIDETNHCIYGFNNEHEDYFLKYSFTTSKYE